MLLSIQMLFRRHSAVNSAQAALERGALGDAQRDLQRFRDSQVDARKPCGRSEDALALQVRLDSALCQAARPFVNKTTLGAMDPIGTVSARRLFVTSDNYAFDAAELGRAIRTSTRFENPYTNQPLVAEDYDRLMRHPHAWQLRNWAYRRERLASCISEATRRELGLLAVRLVGNRDLRTIASAGEVAVALTAFENYVARLPVNERRALENYTVGEQTFRAQWLGVAQGRRCTAVFARNIQRMLLRMAPPTQGLSDASSP